MYQCICTTLRKGGTPCNSRGHLARSFLVLRGRTRSSILQNVTPNRRKPLLLCASAPIYRTTGRCLCTKYVYQIESNARVAIFRLAVQQAILTSRSLGVAMSSPMLGSSASRTRSTCQRNPTGIGGNGNMNQFNAEGRSRDTRW